MSLSPSTYEAVFNRSPTGEYLLSPTPEAIILAVNDAGLRMAQRSREELLGQSVFVAFAADPEDRKDSGVEALRSSLLKVITTGEPDTLALQRYPILVRTPDGQFRYQERFWSAVNTPIHDDAGGLVCIAHSTIDVTELVSLKDQGLTPRHEPELAVCEAAVFTRAQTLQEVNKALEAERRRLQHLFEHAPGFVYFTSGPDHIIEQANTAFYDLVGPRELIGKGLRAAFPDIEGQGLIEMHDEVYRTGKAAMSPNTHVWLTTSPVVPPTQRILDLVYAPILDPDGHVIGVCGQGADITERVRAEQELQDANRRKDNFLAMLGHELRNPLAPIAAATEILCSNGIDAKRRARSGEVIGRQLHYLTSLIDDLLDVSRVSRGLVNLEKAPQELEHVIRSAVEQAQPAIDAHRHELELQIAPEPIRVFGDHKRLVQVLANLLNNAAKYTPAGGHIRVCVEDRGDKVAIKIIDNGIGIPPEFQSRVFELFAQVERSSERTVGGLGLGLALVKRLVELHQGSVYCYSEGGGRGSCFTVVLPRLEAEHVEPKLKDIAPHSPRGPPRKILIVDDNVDAANMLGILLELHDHRVAIEYTAQEGLRRATEWQPDVVLLDIGLPDMDGHELAQRLRTLDASADALFVAVTGFGEVSAEQLACSSFDHYLIKPVVADELMRLLAAERGPLA